MSSKQLFPVGLNSAQFLTEFIRLYKAHPALWNIKHKDYKSRSKKNEAYEVLLRKCWKIDPDCTKENVLQKINSMRGSYRRERKRVNAALRNGNVYKPNLWYYDQLAFLNDVTFDHDQCANVDEEECVSVNQLVNTEPQSYPSEPPAEFPSDSARSSPESNFMPQRKRDDIFESFVPEDEYELFGKLCANKLRKMERKQRIYAEKIINDVLFEAELGNLDRSWRVVGEANNKNDSDLDVKPFYKNGDVESC